MSEVEQAQTENASGHDENVESSTTPEAVTETTEEPKKNKVQERINQLTRKNHEERQRTAELESRIKELESKAVQPKPEIVVPKEDDFEDYSQFQTAQAKYVADVAANTAYERLSTETANQTAAQQQAEDQRVLEGKKKAFDENVESKRANFEDFENVAYGHQFMDLDLANQIFDMDKGPEVAYHLGAHLDEAQRIFSLDPVSRARELTKLEFQVEALKPKKVSDAPDPINPLGGQEKVSKNPDEMTTDEWLAWRHENLANR
jgi:hypothetical protein|tara:strand:- start:594 stop:1379 length:786 start_codon:yes stop_codon:yes gene_type:complete